LHEAIQTGNRHRKKKERKKERTRERLLQMRYQSPPSLRKRPKAEMTSALPTLVRKRKTTIATKTNNKNRNHKRNRKKERERKRKECHFVPSSATGT
jgi:hypothetical protein